MTSKATSTAPIRRHPAFPAAIALWFAALFGMGSLALRAALLEAAVHALRIDSVVPAAAPPLGYTARLLVALLFALGGAVIGYLLARAVRGPVTRAPRSSAFAATGWMAAAGDDDNGLAGDDNDDLARLEASREQPLRRRRTMAMDEAFDPLAAPIPPSVPAPQILNLGELEAVEPLGPTPLVQTAVVTDEATPAPPPAPLQADADPADTPLAGPLSSSTIAALLHTAETDAAETDAAETDAAETDAAETDFANPAPADAPQPRAAEAAPAAPRLTPRSGTAAQLLRAAPLETLGMVELVERFALALSARRAGEPARPDHAAPAMALDSTEPGAPFADPDPGLPESGRPFDMPAPGCAGQSGAAAEPPATAVVARTASPPSRLAMAIGTEQPAGPGIAPIKRETLAGSYSSLLDMRPIARPADGTQAAAETVTEEELRSALAALQRMSGAA